MPRSRHNPSRSFRLLRAICVALVVIGAGWGWQQLKNPEQFPIRTVKVQANYEHLQQEKLAEILTPYANQSFFGLSENELKKALMDLSPWIARVDTNKIWPDGLSINITEQVPVAQWENKGLVNPKGEIFYAPQDTFPAGLPLLISEESQVPELLKDYAQMQAVLRTIGARIIEISLSNRQAITLVLDNSAKIIVGRKDPLPRLQRFVKVYPKIFKSEDNKAETIDLRYEHGLSVKWQSNF